MPFRHTWEVLGYPSGEYKRDPGKKTMRGRGRRRENAGKWMQPEDMKYWNKNDIKPATMNIL